MNLGCRTVQRYCVHGHAVALSDALPLLDGGIRAIIGPFAVEELPDGFSCIEGDLRPYIEAEVLRHLSARAIRIPTAEPCVELYQEGDRFWLVDERWGICELNFLRGQFRSFVLPHASLSEPALAEGAMVWPLAQLLRPRGLHLVQGTSLTRQGFGLLVLGSASAREELARLVGAGWRIVGQRWTALRQEDGRLEMLHIPGPTEAGGVWVNLSEEHQHHAFCDAVLAVESGGGLDGEYAEVSGAGAQELLRRSWPMLDVHPSRRSSTTVGLLASLCRCARVRVSRLGGDLLQVAEELRQRHRGVGTAMTLQSVIGVRLTV